MRPTRRRRRAIYVESRIRAPLERLWDVTQDPAQHQRWDVRFGTITYQPGSDGAPQRFTYATTVVPGLTIAGTGEALGDRDRPDGSRWSGLRFWTADRRSIIAAGGGYWRYVPTDDGVRFLTRYDYRPRWGVLGELLDRWAFRPLFGWATAWSFDRLRLWLEDGIPPERSRRRAVAHASAVLGLVGLAASQGHATASDPAARGPDVRARSGVAVRALSGVALGGVAIATRHARPSGRRPLRRPPDRRPT
ncbi:MAG TPA: hypothetical protein VK891_08070 [Euzebyales bacterium]|nr:hypothetical protein [Euzebyales bacterium]